MGLLNKGFLKDMEPIYMTTRDVYEALEISQTQARKMIKDTFEQIVKEGYNYPSSKNVHIRKFCEVHNIHYETMIGNIKEVRSKRGKYARTDLR